jgi:hypothetical protein
MPELLVDTEVNHPKLRRAFRHMIPLVSSSFNSMAVLSLNQASDLKAKTVESLAAGSKAASAVPESADFSALSRTRSAKTVNSTLMQNLAGALSYSEAQASSLRRIAGILEQLSSVLSMMHDSVQGSDDLNNYMIQFNALRQELVQVRKEKYGQISLHDRSGTSVALKVYLDGSTTNVMDLTQSDALAEGAGALLALLGSSKQDLEVTVPVDEEDSTDYGGEVAPSVPDGVPSVVSGEEGWGTEATNSPAALLKWGVEPLNDLLSSVAQLLSINSAQQQRILSAIDNARMRDIELNDFEGQLSDADVATEVLNLVKADMRTNAGASAMAQANASAEAVAAALYGGAGAGIKWYSSIL